MSKKQRHERKKIERTRYRRSSSHSESARTRRPSRSVVRDGAKALAAAAAIAGGTQAYATPVRFDNPAGAGHFDWAASFFEVLDVTDPAAAQSGVFGAAGTFYQYSLPGYDFVGAGNTGGELQVAGGINNIYLIGVAGGDAIPSGFTWLYYGYIEAGNPPASLLPEGVATYLGVRFDPGDGLHYGWIGVTRTGLELDAFAWGYETDPGVPIAAGAVPEPGTLALLAFGAGAAATRRRRRDHSN